jgi:hypothetical protein
MKVTADQRPSSSTRATDELVEQLDREQQPDERGRTRRNRSRGAADAHGRILLAHSNLCNAFHRR